MKKIVKDDDDEYIIEETPWGIVKLSRPLGRISKMLYPVECRRCGSVYDLTNTEVIHRYADCTLYKTPCCNQTVDDRMWVTNPAYTVIDKTKLYQKNDLRKESNKI